MNPTSAPCPPSPAAALPCQALGQVATPEASRWLQRLCFHFSRKIEVRYDAQQGLAHFPTGLCRFQADGQALFFDCSAATEEDLARLCSTLDEHVRLFARRQPMAVQWQAGQ